MDLSSVAHNDFFFPNWSLDKTIEIYMVFGYFIWLTLWLLGPHMWRIAPESKRYFHYCFFTIAFMSICVFWEPAFLSLFDENATNKTGYYSEKVYSKNGTSKNYTGKIIAASPGGVADGLKSHRVQMAMLP